VPSGVVVAAALFRLARACNQLNGVCARKYYKAKALVQKKHAVLFSRALSHTKNKYVAMSRKIFW
jgi:hypothetical protein